MGCCTSLNYKTDVLSLTPFHYYLDDEELTQFARYLKIVNFKKDTYIFKEGDEATDFFIVSKGVVNIKKCNDSEAHEETLLCSKNPGDFFGISAAKQWKCLDNFFGLSAYRNASAMVGNEDCELLVLSVRDFKKIKNNRAMDTVGEKINKMFSTNLVSLLTEIDFLRTLSQEQLQVLANIFKYLPVQEGVTIFEEGDNKHDMYVVLEGGVQVSAHGKDGKVIMLKTLGPGNFFGEIALMISLPRTATVTTVKKTLLLRLCKENYSNFLNLNPKIKSDFEKAAVTRLTIQIKKYRIPFFDAIPDVKFDEISRVTKLLVKDKDEAIFQEGDDGDSFYLLVHGSLSVYTSESEEPLHTLTAGDFFGEIALVADTKRTATIRVKDRASMLVIHRDDFMNFFNDGPTFANIVIRITQSQAPLCAILEHPSGIELFRTFIKTEFCEENLNFWERVEKFKKSEADLLSQAQEIIKLYIEEQSEFQVNISSSERCKIIDQVIEKEIVSINTFDAAQKQTLMLMSHGVYNRFKDTTTFKRFLEKVGRYHDKRLSSMRLTKRSVDFLPEEMKKEMKRASSEQDEKMKTIIKGRNHLVVDQRMSTTMTTTDKDFECHFKKKKIFDC